MPSGKIILRDGHDIYTDGGCLACFGRYDSNKEAFKRIIRDTFKLPSDQDDVSDYVSHIEVDVDSLLSRREILKQDSKAYQKMEVVFDLLANNSVWADGFQTKRWSDVVDKNNGNCLFEVHGISAQFTISCISILRRTMEFWFNEMYECITEHGMNFQQAYFYGVQLKCGEFSDYAGDEQVMKLGQFSKARLKAFLMGDYVPRGKTTDESYAQMLGYPQEVMLQWRYGKTLEGKSFPNREAWCVNLNSCTGEGIRVNESGSFTAGSMKGIEILKGKSVSADKLTGDYPKILGLTESKVEIQEGLFGKHYMGGFSEQRDLSTGLKFLMEEFLK